MVTDEADAVLAILEKRAAKKDITEVDWQKLFASEGYVRLKKREQSFKLSFEDADFKKFVLSDALAERRISLLETVARWKMANIKETGGLALAYLPKNAQMVIPPYLGDIKSRKVKPPWLIFVLV